MEVSRGVKQWRLVTKIYARLISCSNVGVLHTGTLSLIDVSHHLPAPVMITLSNRGYVSHFRIYSTTMCSTPTRRPCRATTQIAAIAVRSTPKLLGWALWSMIVRLTFLAVAVTASYGSIIYFRTVHAPDGVTYRAIDCNVGDSWWGEALSSCECNGHVFSRKSGCTLSSPNIYLKCFWIASVSWSVWMSITIVNATVSVSVASWWSYKHHLESAWISSRRVVRSSFG